MYCILLHCLLQQWGHASWEGSDFVVHLLLPGKSCSAPPSAIHSTLQHHANTSFTLPVVALVLPHSREVGHTQDLSFCHWWLAPLAMLLIHINTRGFCSDLMTKQSALMLVWEERPHALVCAQLPHCRHRHSTEVEGNKKKKIFLKRCVAHTMNHCWRLKMTHFLEAK